MVLAKGTAGEHCEEKPGLPFAGHSQFHMAPTALPQGAQLGLAAKTTVPLGECLQAWEESAQQTKKGEKKSTHGTVT